MIIKIEDAPHIKNISINIDFTDDGEAVVVQTDNTTVQEAKSNPLEQVRKDSLDLDADFEQNVEEEIPIPEILEEERPIKVSDDMQDFEI